MSNDLTGTGRIQSKSKIEPVSTVSDSEERLIYETAKKPLHSVDTSKEKHFIFAEDVLSGVQLTQAFDAFVDGGVVSDDESMTDEGAIAATPLDFRIDWSIETATNLKECFQENSVFSIDDDSSNSEWTFLNSETCDDVMSGIDSCEQLRELWDQSEEVDFDKSATTSESTRCEVIVDTTWIQPEYPEVWRAHP